MPSCPIHWPRKWISSLPIIFTILTYILIFYIFNLSPSSIFKNTKILFFISNTLILIIAADYGEFSGKEQQNLYREYSTTLMRSSDSKYSSQLLSRYSRNPKKIDDVNYITMGEEMKSSTKEEIEKESREETPEKPLLQIMGHENKLGNTTTGKFESIKNVKGNIDDHKEACDARNREDTNPSSCRSKSRKARRARSISGSNNLGIESKEKNVGEKVYERSKSSDGLTWNIGGEEWENVEEEREFSKMSNEELNNRVEEFIQRFNRQIRLQAIRNRQILSS